MPLTLCVFLLAVQASLPQSPRIQALLDQPSQDRSEAVQRLLNGIQAPLYDADPADPSHTLVTFLWKGEASVVGLVADFADNWSTQRFVRLEGSDLWYRTYSLPSDSRFYYRIAVAEKMPTLAEEPAWAYSDENGRADPLNPSGITIRTRAFSFAELPKAPKPSVYETRGAKEGTFEPSRHSSFQFEPKDLGKHRVWLYKPAALNAKKPCNLIVFLDGSGRFQLIDSITMLDNLIADGAMNQTIAIYTDSPDRDRDLACSDAYLRFLADELIPWVGKRYKVRFTASRTVINGASLGGLFAGFAVLKRPDVFGAALMQSPALWWHPPEEESDWLTRQFLETKKVPGRYYVSPGTFEKSAADPVATGILFSSRWFCDVLRAKRVDVELREVHGGHDPLNWQVSLPEGLLWLLNHPR